MPLDQRTFKKLRRLYIIALTTIAISVFISQVLIGKFLEEQEGDSRLVNLSGRQRMLSQKLTKESLLLTQEEKPEARLNLADSLKSTRQLWANSHDVIQNGSDSLGISALKNERINENFRNLQPYFNNILTASSALIAKIEANPAISSAELEEELQIIKENESSFLNLMDDIVDRIDFEASQKVTRLQNLELLLTLFTLSILLLEFLFIFLPAARGVKNNLRKLLEAEKKAVKMAHDADVLSEAKEKSVKELKALGQAMDQIMLFARISPDGSILHMGEKFSKLFQYRNWNIDTKFSEVLSINQNEQINIDRIISENKKSGWQGEIKATTKNQKDVWLEMSFLPFRTGEDKTELIIICVDITRIKEAQLKIEQLTKENYEEKIRQQNIISRKIIENQENEQNRIAKDIHDGIGQMLTGLKYTLESIDLEDEQKAQEKIENLKELTLQILQGVRTATFNLTPPELTDYGIIPALKKLTEELRELTGKEIIFFNKTDFKGRLDSLKEINIYRITQEAINNAIKYAQSSHIIVSVSHSQDHISISIDDNGKGFTPEKVNSKNGKGGMGLTFMKERIKYIQGRIFINSSPNEGTKVTLNVPLREQ